MRLKCQATKTGYTLLVAVVVFCVMWSSYSTKKHFLIFLPQCFPFSISLSVSSLLVGLILAPVQLIQRCPVPPSERPRLRVSCDTRAWPPVPCLCRRAEELLTPMDFSFADLAESMLCFCIPRQGPWISIFFRRSSSLPAPFPLCVQPYVFLILLNLFYKAHTHFAFALSRPSSSTPFTFFAHFWYRQSRNETHIQCMFFLTRSANQQGYSNMEVFIYVDNFLSLEMFTAQQRSVGC